MGQLSLSAGWENGPEQGLKAVLLNLWLPVIKANSADPDQTPRSVASDLGLHCLPMSQMSQSRFYNPLFNRTSDKDSAAINNRYLDFVYRAV